MTYAGPRRALLANVPGWVLSGASGDLNFAQGLYWAGSSGPVGSQITFANSTGGYAQFASGLWQSFPAGVPRITDQGILSEQSATNEALWARDMTQAAWVATTMTAALTATGIDGTANSASTLTATGASATILQTLTVVSEAQTYSVFLKRISGTGTINITEDGLTFTPVVLTAAWQRFSTTATLANPVIGIQIVSSGDVIAADFNQCENLAFATSPILTTSATAPRAFDSIKLAGNVLAVALTAKAIYTQTFGVEGVAVTAARIISFAGGDTLSYPTSSTAVVSDGANSATATIGNSNTYTSVVKAAFGLDNTSMTAVASGGTLVTQATSVWTTNATAPVFLGDSSGLNRPLSGYIQRIAFGPTKGQFNALAIFP